MPITKQKYNKLDKSVKAVGRNNMRWISLICLTLQTTSIIITYSYSRLVPKGSTKYLSSSVVVLAEILKLAFCSLVIYKDSSRF